MNIIQNPYYRKSTAPLNLENYLFPSNDPSQAIALLSRCPDYRPTPLSLSSSLALQTELAKIWIKEENQRMGVGNFKALGAAFVIARDAQKNDLHDQTYICASAGNHGLSVAIGAEIFGAKAVVYLDQNVPEVFAERLRGKGADVVRFGDSYEQSMNEAKRVASEKNWTLLSDSSWEGYIDIPYYVMEGYTVFMHEIGEELSEPPSHIFLQAGVGGLAAASATMARKLWGDAPIITIVEPDRAPALYASIEAGKPVHAGKGVSQMGRLDCKEPSFIALKGLARDANFFALVSEEEAQSGTKTALEAGFASTPSGTAGLTALLNSKPHREKLKLTSNSSALIIISEQSE